MRKWDVELQQVVELNRAVKPVEAERLLAGILRECTPADLHALDEQLTSVLGTFHRKRREALETILRQRRGSPEEAAVATPEVPPAPPIPTVAESLGAVRRLADVAQSARAAEEFRALVESLDDEQLERYGAELRAGLAVFQDRRRRALTLLLDMATRAAAARRSAPPTPVGPAPAAVPQRPVPAPPAEHRPGARQPRPSLGARLNYSDDGFSEALKELATRHIFQWTTFYRDTLSQYFDTFLVELESGDRPTPWLNLMKAAISQHATEIFQRGYQYQLANNSAGPQYAVTKSLAGAQRFLDLPLEFYSARLSEAHRTGIAHHLRQLCSAMVFGILMGYVTARFDVPGSRILPKQMDWWVHVLPFLTSTDLKELLGNLEQDELLDGVHDSVLPFVRAIDSLLQKDPATAPLPALSQYVQGYRRLEISLQLASNAVGSRRVEVHCHTVPLVDRAQIEQAAGRGVGIVIGPLGSDLRGQLFAANWLSDIVVPTDGSGGEEPNSRLVAMLRELGDEPNSASGVRPIDFNFAAEFPLEIPSLTRYIYVYRSSVRRLMQSFERRNGVRLWCSVRRSGKTTACSSDLGSTSGQSVVVAQTCDSTGQLPAGDVFYLEVQKALTSGARLDPGFVTRTVAACLSAQTDSRVVLVLDEYETLFGDLRTSMERDPGLRYTVVQPLLNQLVAFTRDNLLIFMGQQPDAHWILTDQNQLSPVLSQDAFPLFAHDPVATSASEFHELVQKVMSSHAELDPGFVAEVYAETGGHPFLTCKLLVSFWDWLIANERPASSLAPVRPELFREFAESCLDHSSVAHNHHYDMFKRAAADHLSPNGRRQVPWLHSVYSSMRSLVLESPDTFSLPVDDFLVLAERGCVGISPEDLLSTASRANFLMIDSGVVHPRIRLLGRIAAAVRPL